MTAKRCKAKYVQVSTPEDYDIVVPFTARCTRILGHPGGHRHNLLMWGSTKKRRKKRG